MNKKLIIAVVLAIIATVLSVTFLQSSSNQATINSTAKADSFELQIKHTIEKVQSNLPYTYIQKPNSTEINQLLSTADFNSFAIVSESTFLNYVNESNNNVAKWYRIFKNSSDSTVTV